MEIQIAQKKAKKILITFSGLDGSGKSTLIELIKNKHPEYKYIHMISYRVVNRFFRKKKGINNSNRNRKKSILSAYINLFLLSIDIVIFNLHYKFSTKTFVTDRYFYDILAAHLHRFGYSFLINFLLNHFMIMKPDISFFIEVDNKTAQKREQDGYHDISYFESMKFIYNKYFLNKYFFYVIENKELNSTYNDIMQIIYKKNNLFNLK